MVRLLRCDQCGCASDEQSQGWIALLGDDPDELLPTCVCIFCPTCAAVEFGYRHERADAYT